MSVYDAPDPTQSVGPPSVLLVGASRRSARPASEPASCGHVRGTARGVPRGAARGTARPELSDPNMTCGGLADSSH